VIVALAGGVGGAKMAQGLALALPPGDLTVVVNTGDDMEHLGLHISPDIDTVLYTLGGIANPETGWGIAGDTTHTLDQLRAYGHDAWFWLGDRDFATHIHRTSRMAAGASLTEVTGEQATGLGIDSPILPMTDDPVRTIVGTPDGELAFQDYFVRRRQQDDVTGIRFDGIEAARLPERVRAAIASADLIVLCPSNPIVSIGPILAVPGMREALLAARATTIAVSPIIGGKALKGPADRMMATLGHESSALGVARLYAGLVDGYAIDTVDAGETGTIERETGMTVLATGTIMGGPDDRRRLAEELLAFGRSLIPQSTGTR
jgi:LPPG:FO 2-phospho-L-lactate transferase